MKILLAVFILSLALVCDVANADDKALVQEANIALSKKDFATAFSKFSILAEQGKPAAQFNLGAFYMNGQGVQKNEKKAFEWFRKSASQGNAKALQVIENAAARGNEYAKSELNILQGKAEPAKEISQPKEKPQEVLQEKPQEKLQEKPQTPSQEKPRARARVAEGMLVYRDPTVAAKNKWVSGISVSYGKYKAKEPLYYPVSGAWKSSTLSYSASQPGVAAWVGFDDITVMAAYGKRSGNISSNIQGVGLISKSFKITEFGIDARWLVRQLSSGHFAPYALGGIALNSTSATGNDINFLDVYTQKDRILMLGAGAIMPVDENIGFHLEARFGLDKQACTGNYVAIPGVTLSTNSYGISANATYSLFAASMYYNLAEGWNVQAGIGRGGYSAGIGPAVSNTNFSASIGYAFR